MSELINKEIILTEIFEGGDSIKFVPNGEYYKEGLKLLTRNIKDIEGKIIKMVEFELFHSFTHCKDDPNFNTLNWALYQINDRSNE